VDRPQAIALLDALIGVDAALQRMEQIERQMRGDRDRTLSACGENAHRHRKGLQVTIATIRQHLKYTS
jgi:hypothetical protein